MEHQDASKESPRTAPKEREAERGRELPGALRAQLEHSYGADLSHVRVFEDGVAEAMGSIAVAHGSNLHFARDAFDPNSEAGRHVIAHEVAHVVQQGAVSATSANAQETSSINHVQSLEREAEDAARAALSGAVASLSRGAASRSFQGFDSWEHQLIGDSATGGQTYAVGGLELSHGDLVMLMGDYFDARDDGKPEDNLLKLAATPSTKPGTQVGTQDEVIAAIQDCQPTNGSDPRFAKGGVWDKLVIAPNVKAAMLARFKRLALKNREHFAQPEEGKTAYKPRESAGSSYRSMHEKAIQDAYTAGTKTGDLGDAMVYEACAQHFLTDAFSSGHMRTARADMQTHWDKIYPNFRQQFVNTLGEMVGVALQQHASTAHKAVVGLLAGPVGERAERQALIHEAKKSAQESIGAAAPGFGDVVSSLSHDADNVTGLKVINDLGWTWTAFGDDHMLDGGPSAEAGGRNHFDIIKLAVEAGCNDIRAAGQLGQQHKTLTPDQIFAEIRQRTKSPAKAGVHYGPEQFIPRLAESGPIVNGEQQWRAGSFDELLEQFVRTDVNITYRKAIEDSCRTGTINDQLWSVARSQPVFVADHVDVGLYPYEAFRDGVIGPLVENPIAIFKKIIGA